MVWRKLGLIYKPESSGDWNASHAANPYAVPRPDGSSVTVYFNTRDANSRAHVASFVLQLTPCIEILSGIEGPLLSPGERGLFDDDGVSLGCVLERQDETWLYYLGWNLSVTVPFRNSIGLAVRRKEDSVFRKLSRAPILDRNEHDPYSLSYPEVLVDSGLWRMYYGCNLSWGKSMEGMRYGIKYATSVDGIHWQRDGLRVLSPGPDNECAIAKPSVLHDSDGYRMWFSCRGSDYKYKIGFAKSPDGLSWKRDYSWNEIKAEGDGWESEEVCYPNVFDVAGVRYMLYNGNGYGATGIGLAQLIEYRE